MDESNYMSDQRDEIYHLTSVEIILIHFGARTVQATVKIIRITDKSTKVRKLKKKKTQQFREIISPH